jgi:gluconolactonase
MRLALLPLLLLLSTTALAQRDPFDIRDKAEFAKVFPAQPRVERLASGMKFTEGPVWFDDDAGGYLLFSDIPSNQIKRWSEKDGLSTFREPSNQSNGNYRDAEGRLITCEHAARRVTRTEKDGKITVLADALNGKKLNSPNDAVVKSDGSIWFTDPPYGTPKGQAKEQDKNYVFRLDPKTKELTAVIADCDMPNGLAFSPDEKTLYVADSGKPHHIRSFTVGQDGKSVSDGKVFCTIDAGAPDGIRVDTAGRVYSSAKDGVQVFAPDGKLIGKILLAETAANLCFGGKEKSDLYITAQGALYRIKLSTTGAQKP